MVKMLEDMEAMKYAISEKEELKKIAEMERSSQWLESIRDEIKEKYVGKFIAVKDKKIVANDKNFQRLIKTLEASGEDLKSIFIEFVPSKDLMLIL